MPGDNVSWVAINDVAPPLTNYRHFLGRLCRDYKSKLCHISHLKSASITTNTTGALTNPDKQILFRNPFKVQLLRHTESVPKIFHRPWVIMLNLTFYMDTGLEYSIYTISNL